MRTLLHFIEQKSHNASNLGLKFWWWALETITHDSTFYKQKNYFSRNLCIIFVLIAKISKTQQKFLFLIND
jgi:hypothetical protein